MKTLVVHIKQNVHRTAAYVTLGVLMGMQQGTWPTPLEMSQTIVFSMVIGITLSVGLAYLQPRLFEWVHAQIDLHLLGLSFGIDVVVRIIVAMIKGGL